MIKIEFLGQINKENMEVKTDSLKELKEILKQDENLKRMTKNLCNDFNCKLILTKFL